MSFLSLHLHPNGIQYLYYADSRETSKERGGKPKQFMLGKLDEQTGRFLPSESGIAEVERLGLATDFTATSKVFGPYALFAQAAGDIGLESALTVSFPDSYKLILSLAFFLLQKGGPLRDCADWSRTHRHPSEQEIGPREIAGLLRSLDEDKRAAFFERFRQNLPDGPYLCLVSQEAAEQRVTVVEEISLLPVRYYSLPDAHGIPAIHAAMASLGPIEPRKTAFVFDENAFSEENVSLLLRRKLDFVLACPEDYALRASNIYPVLIGKTDGLYCLLSSQNDPKAALMRYGALKKARLTGAPLNARSLAWLGMKPAEASEGWEFIQFIGRIVESQAGLMKDKTESLRGFSIAEVIRRLEAVKEVRVSGLEGSVLTGRGPLRHDLLETLGVRAAKLKSAANAEQRAVLD